MVQTKVITSNATAAINPFTLKDFTINVNLSTDLVHIIKLVRVVLLTFNGLAAPRACNKVASWSGLQSAYPRSSLAHP